MSTSGSTGSVSSLQLRRLLRVYSDGLRADPENLELRLKLAEVLRLLGRNTEAVALYGSVAWAFAIVGNLAQSIRLCKLILDVSPAHTETQRMLATLYASKEIRDKKQAVPVKKVAGRWVADPRHTESPKVAPETDRFSSVAGEAATDGPALERPATLVTAVEGPFARSTVPGKGLRKKRDTPERPLEKRERPREQEREDVPPPDGPAVATVDPRLLVTESDSPRDDSIGLLPTVDARFDPTDRDAGPPDTVAEIRAGFATTHPSTPPQRSTKSQSSRRTTRGGMTEPVSMRASIRPGPRVTSPLPRSRLAIPGAMRPLGNGREPDGTGAGRDLCSSPMVV